MLKLVGVVALKKFHIKREKPFLEGLKTLGQKCTFSKLSQEKFGMKLYKDILETFLQTA
jgi:hypothetical protein